MSDNIFFAIFQITNLIALAWCGWMCLRHLLRMDE